MDVDDIVSELRRIEERLRDLAYDRLQAAVSGAADAAADEKKLLQARRAVEKAIRSLGGAPEDFS